MTEEEKKIEISGSDKAIAEALASVEKPEKSKSEFSDQLKSLIEKKDVLIKEAHDRLLRLSADYDNFKKRVRKEQDQAIAKGKEEFILAFLPVMDSFERTLEHLETTKDVNALAEGIRLIHRQTLQFLKQVGVTPLETIHKTFDPKYHEAIHQEPSLEHKHMQIIAEKERGYLLADRLIRAAKVVVAHNPEKDEDLSHEAPHGPIKC